MGMLSSDPRPVRVPGVSRTKQEFKDECDVNNIIRRFHKENLVRHLARGVPRYLDVSEIGDFRTAVDQVRAATEFFEGLPAKVRAKFENNPALFLDQAGRLSREELRELGLAELRKDDRPKRRRADVEEAPPVTGGASGTVPS